MATVNTVTTVTTVAEIDARLAEFFKGSAVLACSLVFAAGLLITAGWISDCEPLKSPLSYGGKIHSSVGISFMLAASALAATTCGSVTRPLLRVGQLLALVVIATGSLTLVERRWQAPLLRKCVSEKFQRPPRIPENTAGGDDSSL